MDNSARINNRQKRYVELTEPTSYPDYAGMDDIGSSLITLTVDLDQYRENIQEILDFVAPVGVIAVVKADAYGLGVAGLVPVLNQFSNVRAGVVNADEALYLRAVGYEGTIVQLGYTHPKNYYQIIHSGCELCAYRFDNIKPLADAAKNLGHALKLHVNINTGMNRLGISVDKLAAYIRMIKEYPQLHIVGLYSHLANGGTAEHPSNLIQANRFQKAIGIATGELGYRPVCHIASSGALINFPDLHHDCVRIGALQYGYMPPGDLPEDMELDVRPCFQLASEVVDTHRVPSGEGVGYGWSYIPDRETTIATVPFGYGDGMVRVPDSQLQVLIKGRRYPVVGKIAMDYIEVDVGDEEITAGDKVVIIGRQGEEQITVEEVAEKAGALTYQLTTSLGHRIRRIYTGLVD